MKLEIFRIPRILHSKLTIFHFQAKVEKQALELGDRMSNKPVDIIAEVYQTIRVPSDNIYKSKLVEIEIYKVSLLPNCPLPRFGSGGKGGHRANSVSQQQSQGQPWPDRDCRWR